MKKKDEFRAYRITQWHQNIYGISRFIYILLILRQSFRDVFIHFAFLANGGNERSCDCM